MFTPPLGRLKPTPGPPPGKAPFIRGLEVEDTPPKLGAENPILPENMPTVEAVDDGAVVGGSGGQGGGSGGFISGPTVSFSPSSAAASAASAPTLPSQEPLQLKSHLDASEYLVCACGNFGKDSSLL